MKKNILFLVVVLFIFQIAKSQQYLTDTKGELTVNGIGAANYKVPIALPPGIKDVAPQIALMFDGSGSNGTAGYGWNIVGISSISRISTRIDLDGYIDGVDFDENDQYSLDGQRLIESSPLPPPLGFPPREYLTENYSNLKILAFGEYSYPGTSGTGPERFEVTFADGTQAFYGSTGNSRGITQWLIDKWIDPQGNAIEYEYTESNNVKLIKYIRWSKNVNISTGDPNEIEFVYKNRLRPETAYLQGVKTTNDKLLDYITVKSKGVLFKKYQLTHGQNELNYQTVSKIQEFNGNNEPANPITFGYGTSDEVFNNFVYYKSAAYNYLEEVSYTGDFDGNGKMDFIAKSSGYKLLLNSIDNNEWNPITVPTNGNLLIPPISTLKDGKMMQQHSVVLKTYNTATGPFSNSSIRENHKLYLKPQVLNINNNSFSENYTRTVSYPYLNYTIDSGRCMHIPGFDQFTGSPDTRFLEGDFNGDGISDYVLIGKYEIINYFIDPDPLGKPDPDCNPHYGYQNIKPYFINMNPLISDQDAVIKSNGINIDYNDKQFVIDFDGDGKSDIINIKSYGYYVVYTFTNPEYPETLASGTISEYNLSVDDNKQLVWGDFNGDGKTDLLIPKAKDSSDWTMYISKGNSFEEVSYNNFYLYQPFWEGAPSTVRRKLRQYRAVDLNKDGKSDFLVSEYESFNVGVNDRNGRGNIFLKPNRGPNSSGKITFGTDQETHIDSDYGYEDPIYLITGDFNKGFFDLVFLQGNEIWKGKYRKDQNIDSRLLSVSEVDGKIVSELTYNYLTPNAANGGLGDVNGTYYSSNTETYPFVEIKRMPELAVVTKQKVSALGKSKERQFKYYGLTNHSQGLGILGFKVIAQSSWVTEGIDVKIWNVDYYSPSLRGYPVGKWSFSGNNLNLITNPIDTELISRNSVTYFTLNLPDKRYVYLPQIKTEKDFLTGVTKTTNNEFDSYYNIKKSTLQVEGANASYVTNYTYSNNPGGNGTNYYVGRLLKKNTTSTAYGDTRTSEEKYTYTGNLITKTETKGHNTDYLTETVQYDGFGNVVQKTTSAPGVSQRTVSDQYDSSGRFVIKKTDIDGLETLFSYNNLGQVLTITDPFNTITTNEYNSWGMLKKMTVAGASDIPLVTNYDYSRNTEGLFTVKSENIQTQEYSVTRTDVLGRTIKNTTKGFDTGTFITKKTEYDFLGRVIRESEPYFDNANGTNSPTQWNTVTYDHLSRPIQQTAFTGKITAISYSGLSVTTTENGKSKTITKDKIGNVVTVSDNGQAVNYDYYANNELKSTSYGNHTVSIGIDGWGRKTSMLDPSVSSTAYTYTYNNYGEVLQETTPNGVTDYTYTSNGKINSKEISGDNTAISVTYQYDAKGLITNEHGTSNSKTYSTQYFYDNLYRLNKKKEWLGVNTIEKTYTYDSFGRISTEKTDVGCSTCLGEGMTANSSLVIKNNYNTYNGILDHITDNATGATIWKLTGTNARMQTLTAQFGNGVNIANTYDSYGYIKYIRHTKTGITDPLSLDYTFNVTKATLTNRKNNFYNYTENFTYDNFDRLLSWTTPAGVATNTYEPDGRIKNSSQLGGYNYNDPGSRYKKSSVLLNSNGTGYYTQRQLQEVTYNAFKKPILISEQGRGSIEFEYGIYGVRNKTVEWLTDSPTGSNADVFRTKIYSSGGMVEIVLKGAESEQPDQGGGIGIQGMPTEPFLRIFTYINGNAYSAPAVYVKSYYGTKTSPTTEAAYYYLHRDFQGTVMAVSNQNGTVTERRHFDAWGNVSKYTNSWGVTQTDPDLTGGEFFFDRGYTGHEHFFRVGIIHMNGRIYDPVLKGFMSPDNFVQDPQNSQNFNRYAYCLNNPLMYTDPSGEIAFGVAVLIGVVISAAVYTGVSLYQGNFTWGGLLKSSLIGAVSGAAAFGVGEIASALFTDICASTTTLTAAQVNLIVAAPQAIFHGFSQGFITGISGGDVGQGFVSGMLSSVVSSVVQTGGSSFMGNGDAATILFGTVSGGFSAELTGGNFWQGAATGLVVSGLNHVAHRMKFRSDLRAELRENGIDPNEVPDFDKSSIVELLSKSPTLKALWEKAGYIGFDLPNDQRSGVNGEVNETLMRDSKGQYTSHTAKSVILYKSAFKNFGRLAYTTGHELVHVFHINSGFTLKIFNEMGLIKGRNYLETLAHTWNINHGDESSKVKIKYYQ